MAGRRRSRRNPYSMHQPAGAHQCVYGEGKLVHLFAPGNKKPLCDKHATNVRGTMGHKVTCARCCKLHAMNLGLTKKRGGRTIVPGGRKMVDQIGSALVGKGRKKKVAANPRRRKSYRRGRR